MGPKSSSVGAFSWSVTLPLIFGNGHAYLTKLYVYIQCLLESAFLECWDGSTLFLGVLRKPGRAIFPWNLHVDLHVNCVSTYKFTSKTNFVVNWDVNIWFRSKFTSKSTCKSTCKFALGGFRSVCCMTDYLMLHL